jgi:hypothetical protein
MTQRSNVVFHQDREQLPCMYDYKATMQNDLDRIQSRHRTITLYL